MWGAFLLANISVWIFPKILNGATNEKDGFPVVLKNSDIYVLFL